MCVSAPLHPFSWAPSAGSMRNCAKQTWGFVSHLHPWLSHSPSHPIGNLKTTEFSDAQCSPIQNRKQPLSLSLRWKTVCLQNVFWASYTHPPCPVTNKTSQAPPGSQASSRGESRTPPSSRVATRVSGSPLSVLKGVQPPLQFGDMATHSSILAWEI